MADQAALENKGHPKGLYILFATEMWERFAFYGMRALLTLYLVNKLNYDRADALEIYGTYLGLVYLTPVLGGYLADKYLGARKAIFIGGITMALGQLALAQESMLFVGLGLMIAGNGFFKPNISTIVSSLYEEKDPRRDSAFTVFYMGINLGAFMAPLICGTIGEKVGWGLGFASASIGMAIGLITFLVFQSWLGKAGFPPHIEATEKTRLGLKDLVHIVIWVVASVVIVVGFLQVWQYLGPVWGPLHIGLKLGIVLGVIGLIWGVSWFRGKDKPKKEPFSKEEIERLVVVCVVCFFVVFFWVGFEQAGGTMNLFADANTDRLIKLPGGEGDATARAAYYDQTDPIREEFRVRDEAYSALKEEAEANGEEPPENTYTGPSLDEAIKAVPVPKGFWLFPATWFQSVNPLFIITLAPLFSLMWVRWDKTRFALSTPAKMGWGMIVLGLGFIIMWGAQNVANESIRAGMLWLILVYCLHTTGELFLSPIGLSLVTKLSPVRVVSTMMGLWFASAALADYLAQRMEELVHHFHLPLWQTLIVTSMCGGVVLLAITPVLKKWMHGRG